MEEDIYGDLDTFDSQFEVVRQENEQMKDTIQKLEETSIKFSIEINELKRINTNLEINISTLFKTAKAELERKNKQIAELRKDLDNMLFKRNPKRKMPDQDGELQEKQILTKQFEKVQCELEQKNRIIKKLDIELQTARTEIQVITSAPKRHSSITDEDNDHSKVKKPRLDRETVIENEEVYRNYTNRRRRNENGFYGSRSKSPEYRKFSSRGGNDLRSRIDLKTHNYRRSPSGSRDTFKSNNNSLSRHLNVQYRERYTKSESPLEYGQQYRYNKVKDKRQKYFSEYSDSQTNENSYNSETYENEPEFSDSPTSSIKEEGELDHCYSDVDSAYKKELEHRKILHRQKSIALKTPVSSSAESNNSMIKSKKFIAETVTSNKSIAGETKLFDALSTDEETKSTITEAIKNLCTGDNKLEKNLEEPKVSDEIKNLRKRRESSSTKTTFINEAVTNNTPVVNESKRNDGITSNEQKMCNLPDILKIAEKEVQFSKDKLEYDNDPRIKKKKNSESKLSEKRRENDSTDSEKSSKIKNETMNEKEEAISKSSNENEEEMVKEFILNDKWECTDITTNSDKQKSKSSTHNNETKLESKIGQDKKEKSRNDKPIRQKSVPIKDSESKLKSKNENTLFDLRKQSKLKKEVEKSVSVRDSESKLKNKEVKSASDHSSEKKLTKEKDKLSTKKDSKSTQYKNENLVAKSVEITSKPVSENKQNETKIEKQISKIRDTNILIDSKLNLEKTKVNKKLSESCDSNILIVSEIKSTEIKNEKKISETTNISTISVSKNMETIHSAESKIVTSNLKTVQDSDILKPKISKDVEEINIPQSNSTSISNSSLDILPPNNTKDCTNVIQSESKISKQESTNLTVTDVENSAANIESQNIQTSTTKENDPKPPIRGRRRRCIISIT